MEMVTKNLWCPKFRNLIPRGLAQRHVQAMLLLSLGGLFWLVQLPRNQMYPQTDPTIFHTWHYPISINTKMLILKKPMKPKRCSPSVLFLFLGKIYNLVVNSSATQHPTVMIVVYYMFI